MKSYVFFLLCWLAGPCLGTAQCAERTLTISITTDAYPYELSWKVSSLSGVLIESFGPSNFLPANATESWEVCLDLEECAIFTIEDYEGDGIAWPGSYQLQLDGALILDDTFEGYEESTTVNCASGQSCITGDTIAVGEYLTSFDDHWYVFIPDSSGQYLLTTCELNDCDTKIWVYDNCMGFESTENNQGTIFFDDDYGGCEQQANVKAKFAEGFSYYIRIGDDSDDCMDGVEWSLTYLGKIPGCTDSTSCNYNPVAGIDDGTCIYPGDPDCPSNPDLVLEQDILSSSIYLTTIDNDDPCLIEEGCLNGYGQRDIIRFTTRISNIGDRDYYVGPANDDAGQFTFFNCHEHWHYDSYAEYLLFDEVGQEIPIGFKNGFCVTDIGCINNDNKYNCTDMGISVDCYDEYWSDLECQWIDITDIPDGPYTFVARVNWGNTPDALGYKELDSLNNWAQVCIELDRSSGTLEFIVVDDCPSFEDCAGELLGDAQYDCEGECGGTALEGDVNQDGLQNLEDVQLYAEGVLNGDLIMTNCNDLSKDSLLDVMDIALLSNCLSFGSTHVHQTTGPHDHCQFGLDITAINDSIALGIIDFMPYQYIDIGIRNPDSRIIAYQFTINDLEISDVESLVDPAIFSAQPMMDPLTNQVMTFSTDTTFLERSAAFQPLVRIYHNDINYEQVCVDTISAMIDEKVQRVPSSFHGDCGLLVNNAEPTLQDLVLFPNPTDAIINLQWSDQTQLIAYEIINVNGQVIDQGAIKANNHLSLSMPSSAPGIYWLRLITPEKSEIVKFILQ